MSPPTLLNESEVARLLAVIEAKDEENARLRAELAEEKAKNEALQQANAQLRSDLDEVKKELRLLRAEIKRLRGGNDAGHRIDQGQGTLFGEATPLPTDVVEPSEHAKEAPDGETPADVIKKHHKPKRPARKIDTSLLPREQVRHELPEDERVCAKTGVLLVPVGSKVSEEIDYAPGKLRVIEHHQVEYGPAPEVAKERQIDTMLAPRPPQPLEGCAVSAGLLAHLLVMKYRFHSVPRRHAQPPQGRRSKLCCMEDEGRSLGIGVQAQVSNRLELRGSRARVVSVEGKGAARPR